MANLIAHAKRRQRTRFALKKTSGGKFRLSVHRTAQHIYVQVIDDAKGVTLASASTTEADLRTGKTANQDAARTVGKLIAERARQADVSEVVFDRGGYLFHGRVKALAEAAREAGLKF